MAACWVLASSFSFCPTDRIVIYFWDLRLHIGHTTRRMCGGTISLFCTFAVQIMGMSWL